MRLLITGAGGAASSAIAALWAGTYHIVWADMAPERCAPHLKTQKIPAANHSHFTDAICALATQQHVDLIIPTVDEELPVMERVRRLGFAVLMPHYWYVIIALDKLSMMRELAKHGMPHARTWITKPRYGRGSRDVQVTQEYLDGQEYTVCMCATEQADLRAVVPVRAQEKRGITLRGETENQGNVIGVCTAIHHALPTCGTYNIQGILTEDRGFIPFEINPRVSTTWCLAIAAGVDPVTIWQGSEAPKWQTGKTLHRWWQNQIR